MIWYILGALFFLIGLGIVLWYFVGPIFLALQSTF